MDRRHADRPAGELDGELEALLVRELALCWRELNHRHFDGLLHQPVLRLVAGRSTLGRWSLPHRCIELSRALLLEAQWGSVVEVLKHEMAHQYTHQVLEQTDERAHGPAFRHVCEQMGVDPTAHGLPSVSDDGPRPRLIARVRALLALADSPNRHEAENAAALAQRLMLKHNIELSQQPGRQHYAFRQLGEPKGRVQESEHLLAAIVAEHFFVEAIWVPGYRPRDGVRGHLLELCGTPENLDIACWVHAFVSGTAERLWRQHKRDRTIKGNRDRRTYLAGVMEGFAERLKSEARATRERGLVWLGDADLQRYHRTRHPHIRSVRLAGHGDGEARTEGRAAGRGIVLHRPVRAAAGGGPRRALPQSSRR